MKGKGWWIAGGIALLWMSPMFYGIIKASFFPEKKDMSKEWVAWWLANQRYEAEQRRNFIRSVRPYRSSDYQTQRPRHDCEPEVVYVDRPVVTERIVEVQAPPPVTQSQPNLSGFYYSVPMSGPDTGNMELRYVNGPN